MARFVSTSFKDHTITWTVTGEAPVTLDLDKVSEANKNRAMIHGFVQRCSDNAADEKTAAGKRKAIEEMAQFYASGSDEWERARKGGGVKFDSGAVVAAMARVLFASDVDKANKAADQLAAKRGIGRDDALKLFAADERIAADIARAKAATAKVNADDFLAELAPPSDEAPTDAEPTEPSDEELERLTAPVEADLQV